MRQLYGKLAQQQHDLLFYAPDPRSVLMIGDAAGDVKFAKASGIDSAWVEHGYGSEERRLESEPTHTYTNLPTLTAALLSAAPEPSEDQQGGFRPEWR